MMVFVLLMFGVGYYNSVAEEKSLKEAGIFSNANRLNDDYNWKLDLVTEIQKRTDALGEKAGREYYVEWIKRNNDAIDSGERLATYLEDNRELLDNGNIKNLASDTLTLIAKNKVTFERDNQGLNQIINAPETDKTDKYTWEINYYGLEGGDNLGILKFENKGNTDLNNVTFRFEFYKASGAFYTEKKYDVGDVPAGQVIQKKVSLPAQYSGYETWSKKKVFVRVNGGVWNEEKLLSYD